MEKIVQSMTATTTKVGNNNNNQEAESQYHAQVDVITQLAERVDQQLATAKRQETGAVRTALIKLEGDFRRVKDRVAALQESVSKMRQQSAALKKQQAASAAAMDSHATEESMGYEEFQRHMELQLQQDVSLILMGRMSWSWLLFACVDSFIHRLDKHEPENVSYSFSKREVELVGALFRFDFIQ